MDPKDFSTILGDKLPWESEEETIETPQTINLHHDPDTEHVQVQDNDTSKDMWLAMEKYHNMGLSMMWGRAEDEPAKNKKAKSPIVTTWSSEPETKFSLEELSKVMSRQNPKLKLAPIIICGKGSGNLIVIDIDIKHWPGIDTKFLLAFQETYPSLYKIIRRHKTPSNGWHLLYRIIEYIDITPKNPKLAYAEGSTEAGIETRTHGGYVMAPPGMGYSVEYDVEIPTISIEDHERIFALARLFNEKIPTKKTPKPKIYESIYDENPFDHFDSSPDAERVLSDNGWTFDYENSQWTHYTRPGKDGGVSASWHREKRFFHIFTSSTDLIGKNFSPSHALCQIRFNNDWKKLYAHLADRGFGIHKPGYEAKVIQKLKETGKPLPKNFSSDAQEKLQVAITEKNEKYPHGIFWEYDPDKDSYTIQRLLIEQFMFNIGLRLYKGEPVIIEGQFIRKLKEDKKKNGARDVYTIINSWIKEEEEGIYKRIYHEFSKFWQASGEFTVSLLKELDEKTILKSNAKTSYKVFLNGILKMTKDGKSLSEFSEYSGVLIWRDSIIQHKFNYIDFEQQQKSMYVDYVNKAFHGDYRYKQLCIGYLGHESKKGEQYLVCLLEPMATEDGGGTGKNTFCYMLSPWTSVLTTDAQALKRDVDQLIQNWDGQRVVHLSDFPEWTNLGRLKNIITDDSQRKLLYKDISNVSKDDMPKFVLSGQHGLDTEGDGGVKRRVRIISFTGYFNRTHGLRDEYGGEWPDLWDDPKRVDCRDYDGYFSYMADAEVEYLKEGKIPVMDDLRIWLKGFDVRYSGGDNYFREALEDKIEYWGGKEVIASSEVMEWYEEVFGKTKRSGRGKMSARVLHKAIKAYGEMMKLYDYEYGDDLKKEYIDGVQQRVVKIKMFLEKVKEKDPWD